MEYPGLRNNNKSKEKVSDLIIVDNASKLPYNSKSGSIAEVVNKGVKELALDAIFPHLFYIHINNTSIGDIAQTDDGKILSILRDLEAVYYTSNNLKKTINYLRVAILGLIYREYEIDETLHWKNLNNIKIFTFRSSKDAYLYNGEEWEKMDYVQKSDFVFDKIPTQDSSNLLTSGVIYNELINKADLINGKVPSDLLPSYVDDVLEFPSIRDFPQIGEPGKIYIDINATTSYRWTGSIYKEIQSPIELDEYPILGSTNAVESGGVYSALLKKLDIISDLSEIRLGAAAGATALLSFTETDPTVSDWAKLETKPSYTYSEILNTPTNVSEFINDAGYLTTHLDISSKQDTLVSGENIKTINNESLLGSGNISVQTPLTFDSIPTTSSTNPVTSGGVATALTSYVTLSTSQNVTGEKTFVGAKKIKFKKSTANDKLGFTLYDNNNKELSYLEYNTGDLCLGSYYSSSSLQVKSRAGFKMSDVSSGVGAVYRILTPYAADAKTPFNLTSTTSDFYFPLGVSNGTTTLVTNSTGLLDISSFFNNYYTKTDTDTLLSGKQGTLVSGTDIKTINGNSILGSGDLEIDGDIYYDGSGTGSYSPSTDTINDCIDSLDSRITALGTPNEIASITAVESNVSGGNNVVTITDTDGNSTSFNVKNGTDGKDGQDGTDGVSLGEIALVQTTGDSEESVMSQKAVTEYGRKVTAEDLNGTSEWIRAGLTAEGWEFGKKVIYNGTTVIDSSYCASPFIPINGVELSGHSFTYCYMYNNNTSCCITFYDINKNYIANCYAYCNANNLRDFNFGTNTAWESAAYVRMTLNPTKLDECYLRDNTTAQYIFKFEEHVIEVLNRSDINVGSEFLEEYVIKQEMGESTVKTMSQKAITDAINYNTNIENAEGFTLNSNATYRYIKLTSKATSLLNASDKMTFMFSTKGTGKSADYRYFRFGNGSITANGNDATNGVYVSWSYSRNLSANDISYTLNQMGSKYPTPDVWIVTWDRVNGIVRFYDHTTLVNTLSGDNYKKERFVNDEGKIVIFGGDNNTRIYDIRLFDYDISYLFGYSDISNEIKNLEGAGILPSQFLNNYNDSDGLFMTITNSFVGGGYNTCTYTLNGDDYHIVVKDTTTTSQICGGKPYYLGVSYRAQLEKLEFEVVSGVIKHSWRNTQENENLNYRLIVDENGDEIADYDNIGVGKYTLIKTQAALGSRFDFYKVSGDVEVVINRNMKYKPISCVFHLRGDTMYNKKFYDDQTNSFITLYTDHTCSVEYINHTLVKTPQRVIRTEIGGNNGLPHYAGEMAVVGDKVYIGMPDYTWKQINNS